jgi:hypothetical protein
MNISEILEGVLSTIVLMVAYGGFAIFLLISLAIPLFCVFVTPLQVIWLIFAKYKNRHKYYTKNFFFNASIVFFIGFYFLTLGWLLHGKQESGPFIYSTLIAPLLVFEYLFWKSYSVLEVKASDDKFNSGKL